MGPLEYHINGRTYKPSTVIVPIDIACKLNPAVLEYNGLNKDDYLPLDIRIMRELKDQPLGMRAMTLRDKCRDGKCIYSVIFNRSINKLLEHKLITRREHRKYVYYNITMKGRNVLEEINNILVRIVQEEFDERMKNNPLK